MREEENNVDFIKFIDQGYASPDLDFKNNLRKKVLNKYTKTSIWNELITPSNWKFIFFSFFITTLVVFYGGYQFSHMFQGDVLGDTTVISQNDTRSILLNVLKNNNLSLVKQSGKESIVNQLVNVGSILRQTSIKPTSNELNYRNTRMTLLPSNNLNVCGSDIFPSKQTVINQSEYFTSSTYNIKNVITTIGGGLINFQLVKASNNIAEIIQYNGGDVAQRYVIADYLNNSKNLPISYAETFSSLIQNISSTSSDNSQILQSQNTALPYLLLKKSYTINCENSNPTSYSISYPVSYSSKSYNLIYIEYIDPVSFKIVKEDVYLDNTNKSNLIGTIQIESNVEKISQDEANLRFAFNYNAQIKNI